MNIDELESLLVTGPLLGADVQVFSGYDFVHPTKAGAELIARMMVSKLDQLGWLPPRSTGADRADVR